MRIRLALAFACSLACALSAAALADAPPDTTIDFGPQGLNTLAQPTFRFSSDVAGATFRCSLDHAPFAACASPFELPALAQGQHVFDVQAVDSGGQADPTPAERTWTYLPSIAAPAVRLLSPRQGVRVARLGAIRGSAAAADGVVKVQVAMMVAGSRHDVSGPHPQQCTFADMRSGRLESRICIGPPWRTARGTTHWSLKLSRSFRAHLQPGRYIVIVRAVNDLGLQRAYNFRRSVRA